jgi:hypothetical protein
MGSLNTRSGYWPTTRNPLGAAGAAPADWDSVTVRPATVADVVRPCDPVCTATENVTVPVPLPDAPAAILIQEACSDADQLQPLCDVTLKVTLPPLRTTDCAVGDTVYVHGTPAWFTAAF